MSDMTRDERSAREGLRHEVYSMITLGLPVIAMMKSGRAKEQLAETITDFILKRETDAHSIRQEDGAGNVSAVDQPPQQTLHSPSKSSDAPAPKANHTVDVLREMTDAMNSNQNITGSVGLTMGGTSIRKAITDCVLNNEPISISTVMPLEIYETLVKRELINKLVVLFEQSIAAALRQRVAEGKEK